MQRLRWQKSKGGRCDGHGHMSPAQSIPISGSKMTQFPFPTAPVTTAINLHSHSNPSNWLAHQAVGANKTPKAFYCTQQAQPHEQTQLTGRRGRTVEHKNHHAQVKPPTTISDRAATARSAARANTRAASAAPDRTSRVDTAKGRQKPHRYLKSVLYSR